MHGDLTLPDITGLVEDGRIHSRLYLDDAIFAAEMDLIFRRNWVYVGHESSIREEGDYIRSMMGTEPVVVTRGRDGDINVVANRCAHRGALVCRQESGNSKFLRCPYHGWTYRSDGTLAGAPHRHRYPDDINFDDLSLAKAAKVEVYRGLIFASFSPDVPSLETYLAPVKPYIDATFDFSISGEVSLTEHSSLHQYLGNWKLQMENGVDGYHTAFVHETFFEMMGRAPQPELKFGAHGQDEGWTESFDFGHALLARNPHPDALESLKVSYPDYVSKLMQRLGADGFRQMMTHMNLFIFPNLYLIAHHIRVITPVSAGVTNVSMTPYLLEGAPSDLNERRLREHEAFYPAAAFGSPDDFEIFSTVQKGLESQTNPWVEYSRGLGDESVTDSGSRRGQPTDEGHQRGMYRYYRRLMTEGAGQNG